MTNTLNFLGSRDDGRLTLYNSPRLTAVPDRWARPLPLHWANLRGDWWYRDLAAQPLFVPIGQENSVLPSLRTPIGFCTPRCADRWPLWLRSIVWWMSWFSYYQYTTSDGLCQPLSLGSYLSIVSCRCRNERDIDFLDTPGSEDVDCFNRIQSDLTFPCSEWK